MAVNLTKGAIEHCIQVRNKQGFAKDKPLRFGVRMGGCSGMEYDVKFDEVRENDKQFEFSTAKSEPLNVVVDPKSYLFINNVVVDYQVTFMDSKFVFNNPNATASCGCGTSFDVKK